MESSANVNLDALLAASRSGEAASVASNWRQLTPVEQENVLFTLLGMQADVMSEGAVVASEESPDPPERDAAETQAMEAVASEESPDPAERPAAETEALDVVEQTELIPKHVEDLRGLTGSEGDEAVFLEKPAAPSQYWSRWRRRWKISALVAAWAVTTVFAFTVDTSRFAPMEWVVALFGTVVLGGALVGTLVNFAVASILTRAQEPTADN